MAEDAGGKTDKLGELIERFEEDVRQRPLPPGEVPPAPAPPDTPAAPAQGSPMAPAVVEELRAELADVSAAAAAPAVEMAAPPVEVAPARSAPPAEPEDLETWWRGGERVEVEAGGRRWAVFARVVGDGPWLTAIHGLPTSSWDWEPVSRELRSDHRILALDLLGFGDSDKPRGHDWSTFEQADIVEALWRHFGVTETKVLAHDVGLTVALELLARQADGGLAARITGMTLLNGGVYPAFHRPRRVQVLLQRPVIGALVARLMSEARFSSALAEVFGPEHQPPAAELHQHWLSVARHGGARNFHHLIKYIPERRVNAARWEGALERTQVPLRFAWGMADPVSGAHMADVIRERRPGADLVELEGVGHYPQLEAPAAVVEAVRRA